MNVTDGQKASRALTLTPQHVQKFAEITGDYNPQHFRKEFVSQTRFKELVLQGGFTTGLLHALVAMELPGPGTLFLSQNWKFTAPVFIGDTITAEAEVRSVHPSKPVTQLKVKVTRQTGEITLEGEAWCYTLGEDNMLLVSGKSHLPITIYHAKQMAHAPASRICRTARDGRVVFGICGSPRADK